MPHTQQPSHGHGKGAQPGHKHPKGPSNAAENEAINLANSEAQAHGTHHRHVVNDGTSEIDDVKFMPLPATGAQPATAAAAPPTAEEVDAPKVRPLPFNVPNYTAGAFAALEEGVRKGTHAIGRLGVKQWTTGVGFVRNPSVFPSDIFIGGIENRGKGLPGDIVVVELKPRSEWKDAQREGPDGSHVSTLFPASKDDKDAPDGAVAEQPKLADGRTIEHVIKHETKARVVRDDVDRVYQTIFGTTPIPVVDWPTNLQPEGKVVEVLERRYEQFQCCRFFEKQQEGQPYPPRIQLNRWYRFKSYSDDFPVVGVYGRDIPENFREKVHEYLFLIQVAPVPQVDFVDGRFPVGRVAHSLGQSGTVAAESTAISYTFKVKDAEFTEEVNACVFEDFQIPSKEELAQMGRRDLRDEEFVTTIDPATARDLDDALSITRTPGGYRVGVHIADVSFFVPVNSALDEEARLRATSTYYVERVIPMLPRKLCEDYCSLNAGVDKFAFSGIWHFDRKGNVQSEWFGQSVIRNRCRMAYEDAQYIIDGDESGNSLNFVNESEPREVLVNKVVESVKAMQELAIILRLNRFDRGALSLNKGKLKFIFEDFNSLLAPKGLTQERSRAANFLVEEFMLHANCRVGEKVVQFMPDCALLRKHDPPVKKKIQHLVTAAGKFGFKITATSSKALRDSLDAYRDHPDCDSLKFMATICMSLAKYTSSDADKQHSVAHYALAAPIYTHFTSPIRRYADLIIHRQLLLALDIEREVGKRSQQGLKPSDVDVHALPHHEFYLHPEEVQNIAEHCNERKEAAKRAGEASMVLFLCLFINATKAKALAKPELPTVIVLRAVVVRLQDNRFTLYLSDIALTIEIFYNAGSQRWKGDCMPEEDSSAFTVNWGSHPQTSEVVTEKLTLFSQVLVTLSPVIKGHMQLDVIVHPPWERDPSRVTPLDFQL